MLRAFTLQVCFRLCLSGSAAGRHIISMDFACCSAARIHVAGLFLAFCSAARIHIAGII